MFTPIVLNVAVLRSVNLSLTVLKFVCVGRPTKNRKLLAIKIET